MECLNTFSEAVYSQSFRGIESELVPLAVVPLREVISLLYYSFRPDWLDLKVVGICKRQASVSRYVTTHTTFLGTRPAVSWVSVMQH